ncbi:MAG: hypothetical protein HY821_14640 [Acidobacteria bacterium]|nr:hypothetical protein [Acidobacteriota bacterium]
MDSRGNSRGELWQEGHLNMVRALDLDRNAVVGILDGGHQEIPTQASLLAVDPRSVAGAARAQLSQSSHTSRPQLRKSPTNPHRQ